MPEISNGSQPQPPDQESPLDGRQLSLAQRVMVTVRNDILTRRFQPGQRVTVDQLARRFAVSRTPVRDAIKLLEQERLVQVVPRQHIVVRGLDLPDLIYINRIRSVLEGLAAREATQYMSDADLKACGQILADMEATLDRHALEEYRQLHVRFHLYFIRSHENWRLRVELENLYDYIALIRKVVLQIPQQQLQSRFEHRAIFQALSQRDAGKAELLTRVHVDNFEQHLPRIHELLQGKGGLDDGSSLSDTA